MGIEVLPSAWIDSIRAWASANGNVDEVWLFGSRAKGTHRGSSDIDLAVRYAGNEFADRLFACHRCAPPTGLPVEVDLDMLEADTEIVGPAVADHGVLIYRRAAS